MVKQSSKDWNQSKCGGKEEFQGKMWTICKLTNDFWHQLININYNLIQEHMS